VRRVRLRLRRFDGGIFLDRWGFEADRLGGIFLHKMSAPDPGIDLHDHPWFFASLIIKGGYIEERALCRDAPDFASIAEQFPDSCTRGGIVRRMWGSWRTMRLDECHRITELTAPTCWTLVVHGPRRRMWGFFLPTGWVDERTYDETVRIDRRDLWNEAV
jgi:hypothetical protein